MKRDKTIDAFLALVRAGLWERDILLSNYRDIDFSRLCQLAEEQSVDGLIAAGLEHVMDVKLPQESVLELIGLSLQIEQQNIAMNEFIAVLERKMADASIHSLLVKGQGVAQCYERPLWRSSGDVDLFLDDENYEKAKVFLSSLASFVKPENPYTKHINMEIGKWAVELHGNMRSNIIPRIDDMIDSVQEDTFINNKVRIWQNGNTIVLLPSPDNDVIFIFTHILHHFYRSGIGLRQICDWCRLLYTFRNEIDNELLKIRLEKAGIMAEWIGFGHFAVEYLGLPKESMPFYGDLSKRDDKKCRKILSFILETGNFGHNRDRSFYTKYPYLIRKSISFWRYGGDIIHHLFLFPSTSFRYLMRFIINGLNAVLKGE